MSQYKYLHLNRNVYIFRIGFCAHIVNKGIKCVGIIVQKISENIGSYVGIFREKILKHKGEKERWYSRGKVKGRVLKRDIDNIAENASKKVDEFVKAMCKVIRTIVLYILIALNKLAKITYEGTEKLKSLFEEYNVSKESELKNHNLKDNNLEYEREVFNNINMNRYSNEDYERNDYINKVEENEGRKIDIEKTQIMSSKYTDELRGNN